MADATGKITSLVPVVVAVGVVDKTIDMSFPKKKSKKGLSAWRR